MFIFQSLSKSKVGWVKMLGYSKRKKYSAVAQSLLSQSVASDNPAQVAILRDKVNCHQPHIWTEKSTAALMR